MMKIALIAVEDLQRKTCGLDFLFSDGFLSSLLSNVLHFLGSLVLTECVLLWTHSSTYKLKKCFLQFLCPQGFDDNKSLQQGRKEVKEA